MCCSVLQCVAVCCRVLQCVAVCCSVLQSVLQCVLQCVGSLYLIVNSLEDLLGCLAVWCKIRPPVDSEAKVRRSLLPRFSEKRRTNLSISTIITVCVLQCGAACCSVLQRVAVCYSVLQCVAAHWHICNHQHLPLMEEIRLNIFGPRDLWVSR